MRKDGEHACKGSANMHAGGREPARGGLTPTQHLTHITNPHTHTQIHTRAHTHTHITAADPSIGSKANANATTCIQTKTQRRHHLPTSTLPTNTYPNASLRTKPAPSNQPTTHPPAYSYLPSAHTLPTPIPLPHPLAQHKRYPHPPPVAGWEFVDGVFVLVVVSVVVLGNAVELLALVHGHNPCYGWSALIA